MTIMDRGIAEWEEWMKWEDKWNSIGLSTKEYQTQKSADYRHRKGKERGSVLQCEFCNTQYWRAIKYRVH